jgi:nitrate/nitrite-specific signal transduction histidine kinase
VISSAPFNKKGRFSGMMVGRANTGALIRILDERTGLGDSGKSYLVGQDHTLWIGDGGTIPPLTTGNIHTSGLDAAVKTRSGGSGIYDDYNGVRVLGAYRWLPELQMALLIEQDLSEAFRAVYTSLSVNLGIALVAVLLAASASLLITRSISVPLINLAETASLIAAGDLQQVASVERGDEIGALATAFNSMTAQLRDLIANLEERVRERTNALRQRALELETSALVSREVTSILDMDQLLPQVVELIRTAFGHYHVHIFLVEEETNYLVLRASSGFPSAHLHRLSIGDRSLNSRAVQRNEAVMVNDVMHDPDFRGDEQLAEVRSELVVPLRIGDRIIGTLDVQGAEVDTFSPEDVLVIQSLGDQTAIAIENARHYRQARQAATMAERQRLARELHDSLIQSLYSLTLLTEGGRRLAASGRLESATGYFTDLWEIARQSLKEMRLLIYELRPIALESAGLVGAIQQRLDAVEGRAGVEARLLLDGELEFPPLVEEALYRIAQEALNNALKHAAATMLTVRLETRGGQISLQIQDNGRGFDLEEANQSGGLGLSSMRERAEQMGGELTIQTNPENGTVVQVTVEVPDE